jgi:hypothetical protein
MVLAPLRIHRTMPLSGWCYQWMVEDGFTVKISKIVNMGFSKVWSIAPILEKNVALPITNTSFLDLAMGSPIFIWIFMQKKVFKKLSGPVFFYNDLEVEKVGDVTLFSSIVDFHLLKEYSSPS